MPLNDIILQKIKNEVGKLCTRRTPEGLKDKLRFEYEIEKQKVIIYEIRPAFLDPKEYIKMPMAKLTYVSNKNTWKLYWKRASGKWMRYEPRESKVSLKGLVQDIDEDIYGCFFG